MLLFVEDDPSIVVVRAHFDPHVHSLHDQSLQVGMIKDPYIQHLSKAYLSFEETNDSLGQVLHTSLSDLHSLFLAVLEGVTINIKTWIVE